MGLLKEFGDFAMRGNVIDMAVGIVIGTAFGAIVGSLVADVIMPPVGVLLSGVDFSELGFTIKEAVPADPEAGTAEVPAVVVKYGLFINAMIKFVIVAFAMFMVIKVMNKAMAIAKRKQEQEAAAPPPTPTAEVKLLEEIRDLLQRERA
ncbi:MAG: large-conductance mechanosensitive channel protein MscL [Phycisphaerales bacterium]